MSLQVYLYSFDVFQAAGIAKEDLRYAALGTGLCEVSTSIACVSCALPPQPRAQIFHLSSKHDVTWFKGIFWWFCVVVYGVIFIQVLIIESTGKRVLLFRGYLCMAASLAMLTVTLYLQVWLFFSSLIVLLPFYALCG